MQLAQIQRLVQRAKLPWKHLGSTPQLLINRRKALLRLRSPTQINIAAEQHFNRTSVGEKGVYGPNETLAYISRRLLPAHSVLRRVLGEAKFLKPESRPIKRMLDFGSGPGTAIWAAGAVWPDTLISAYAVDKHRSMLDALEFLWNPTDNDQDPSIDNYRKGKTSRSNEIMTEIKNEENIEDMEEENEDEENEFDDFDLEKEMSWLRELNEETSNWKPPHNFRLNVAKDELTRLLENVQRNPNESRYDLVTAAWVLGDINTENEQDSNSNYSKTNKLEKNKIKKKVKSQNKIKNDGKNDGKILSELDAIVIGLWECVAPGGFLILTDYGDLKGSKRMMDARALILSNYGRKDLKNNIGKRNDGEKDIVSNRKKKNKKSYAEMIAPCTHQYTCPFANSRAFNIVDNNKSSDSYDRNSIKKNNDNDEVKMDEENRMHKAGRGGSSGGWCRFVQRVVTPERKQAKGYPTADERFSYLVIYKTDPSLNSTDSKTTMSSSLNATDLITQNDDVIDDISPIFGGRVMRTPLKRKGHTIVDVCRPNTYLNKSKLKDSIDIDEEIDLNNDNIFHQDNDIIENDTKNNEKLSSSKITNNLKPASGGASIERVVISKSKLPTLYTAARKASWGGHWIDHEGKYHGLVQKDNELTLDEITKWYKEIGYSEDDAFIHAKSTLEYNQLEKEKVEKEREASKQFDLEEIKLYGNEEAKKRKKLKAIEEDSNDSLANEVDNFLKRIGNINLEEDSNNDDLNTSSSNNNISSQKTLVDNVTTTINESSDDIRDDDDSDGGQSSSLKKGGRIGRRGRRRR